MNLDNLAEIQKLLVQVDSFIHMAMSRTLEIGYEPNDALRGLVISRQEAEHLLSRGPLASFWSDSAAYAPFLSVTPDQHTRFSRLLTSFDLTELDAAVLLLTLAPELDRRYERLYGYLQDDVSQRRPTINLMMNLLGHDVPSRFAVWDRLSPDKPLRNNLLITVEADPSSPASSALGQRLKVDARVVAWLLGDNQPDERLKGLATRVEPVAVQASRDDLDIVYRAIPDAPIVLMVGPHGIGRRAAAAAICAGHELSVISLDLARLTTLEIPPTLAWKLALREARLEGAAVVALNWESCLSETGQPPNDLWQALMALPTPLFICSREPWEPQLDRGRRIMLRLSFDRPDHQTALALWTDALAARGITLDQLDSLVNKYRLTPIQITHAVSTAADIAASRGDQITLADVYAGAKAHSSLRLGRLAKHIIPRHRLEDLILPHDRLEQLGELCTRAEHAYIVQDVWGFARRINPRPRISALFSGESGTGKTMAAEAIASELSLPLYRIDLSSVVSKYIGETEKNLSVIFEEAQSSNAILFFDEADAIFGKRSEVKDAHDRYANIEIAYLLQQIEDYDGIALLATNLRQNLDTAFTRRLDFVIDFPFPEPEYRQRIWAEHFPPEVPLAADIDFRALADRYPLAGGNIRNVAVASAYLAAADGGVVTMRHITSAIRREHQKIGRLVTDEF